MIRRRRYVLGLAGVLLVAGIWQALASLYTIEQLPGPLVVVKALGELFASGVLLKSIAISLARFFTAYLLASAAAVPLGLWLGRSLVSFELANPALQLLRPISPIAWFPLAVLWFGIGNAPAVFIIFLAAFFPVLLATVQGVHGVAPLYLKVAANFGASPGMVFCRVVLPAAFPSIATGLRIAIGTAWIHLVAGEMLGAQSGLGFLIVDARNFLRTDCIMAGMLVVGVLGLCIDSGVVVAERFCRRRWGMA